MGSRSEVERIMTLLENGKITAEEATKLIRALSEAEGRSRTTSGSISFGGLFDVFRRFNVGPNKTHKSSGTFAGDEVDIKLVTINGGIVVKPTDGDQYELEVDYYEEEGTDEKPYAIDAGERSLTVEASRRGFGTGALNIRLALPRRLTYNLELETVNGRVQAQGLLCNRVEVSTSNGRIAVDDCRLTKGTIQSRNGQVSFFGSARELAMSSHTGSLELKADPRVSGEYRLVSHVGSIRCLLAGESATGYRIRGSSQVGRVAAALPGTSPLKVGNLRGGHVEVSSPDYDAKEVKIDITASSHVGAVEFRTGDGLRSEFDDD